MLHNLRAVCFTVIMLFATISLFAQPKENDPYTILGFGNINNLNFAGTSAMPGLSATYSDAFHMNIQNPATSSFLTQAAFEVGTFYQYKNMKTPTQSDRVNTGNLSYLALGLPLINQLNQSVSRKKKPFSLGMTFSLTPYSSVGYDLERTYFVEDVGEVQSTFEGNGGTYKFLWGNSIKYKGISVGANIGYLFGKQTQEEWDYFLDFNDEYRNFSYDQIRMGGFIWSLGALYEYVLPQEVELDANGKKIAKQRTRISIGAYGNSNHKINTTSERIQLRRQTVSLSLVDVDTVFIQDAEKGKITLPGEFGVGIMMSRDANWKIGIDYSFSSWDAYENEINPATLLNSYKIAFGAEYVPKHNAPFSDYRKRILYRIGGYYKTDPRTIDDKQITQSAVTFGVGLPLQPDKDNRKFISFVNLSAEVGQYGNPDFLKETYFKLNVGFTLNDNLWFFKRKYN